MKKKQYPRLRQPENYVVTEQDITNIEEYNELLDHLTNVVVSEPLHKIDLDEIGIGTQKAMIEGCN